MSLRPNKNFKGSVTGTGRVVVYKNRLPSSGDDAKLRIKLYPVDAATFTANIEISDPDAAEWIPLRGAPAGTVLAFEAADSVVVSMPSSCDVAVNVTAITGTVNLGAGRVNS